MFLEVCSLLNVAKMIFSHSEEMRQFFCAAQHRLRRFDYRWQDVMTLVFHFKRWQVSLLASVTTNKQSSCTFETHYQTADRFDDCNQISRMRNLAIKINHEKPPLKVHYDEDKCDRGKNLQRGRNFNWNWATALLQHRCCWCWCWSQIFKFIVKCPQVFCI